MSKPGVMIYFKNSRVVDKLTDQDAGKLLRGILQYAENGENPEFASGNSKLGLVWEQFRRDIDADTERYKETVLKRLYANYCKEEKKGGREPDSYTTWKQTDPHDTTWYHMDPHGTQITNNNKQIANNNKQIAISNKQIANIYPSKKEDVCAEKKKMLWEGISFLPSSGDRDLELVLEKSTEEIWTAAEEAKEKGLSGYAGWLYVSSKLLMV